MSPKFRCAAAAALLAAAWPAAMAQAQAQAPKTAPAPMPAAPPASTASSAGPAYASAFERFKRFDDQPVGSWRDANDTVGRIGGWKAYAREGQGGAAASGGLEPAMPAGQGGMRTGPAGHSGHRMP